jgi:type III secretion system TyeA family effector delivery regulator
VTVKPTPPNSSAYTAHDLMREILQMTNQRWTEPERFSKIATDASIQAVDARIYFLTQMREKIRLMPLKLFSSQEARDKMLEALQAAIDQEISREEGP